MLRLAPLPLVLFTLADGSFLVGERTAVWRADRQGIAHPVAGDGHFGDSGDGGPAPAAEFDADALAALPGGGFAFADDRVLWIASDGTAIVAARTPAGEHLNIDPVAATADGGFVLTDDVLDDDLIDHTRVWRVAPDGTMDVLAGGGPFAATAPAGLAQDADGQPALRAAFGRPRALAVEAALIQSN
jgi:hypothetical protein